jgi:Na+/H+ antiporter NhaD/arsenite permease-like protein
LSTGGAPDNGLFYRLTGLGAALFGNAPAYLVFLSLAARDANLLMGPLAHTLAAISAGAVYFGGVTYIGNVPNLLAKNWVESHGIRMPGFFGYILWAALCLLPWLFLTEAIFFGA